VTSGGEGRRVRVRVASLWQAPLNQAPQTTRCVCGGLCVCVFRWQKEKEKRESQRFMLTGMHENGCLRANHVKTPTGLCQLPKNSRGRQQKTSKKKRTNSTRIDAAACGAHAPCAARHHDDAPPCVCSLSFHSSPLLPPPSPPPLRRSLTSVLIFLLAVCCLSLRLPSFLALQRWRHL
jgi:hypothetical protein